MLVNHLLADEPEAESPIFEASVHRPKRGTRWMGVYTGSRGGQVWKSTGLTDREAALQLARRWEAAARTERAKLGRIIRKPVLRVRRPASSSEGGPLSQKEVALLLGLSERGIREIERRAFEKLRQHPLLREVWRQFLTGELDEQWWILTSDEIQALFNLAQTPEEGTLIQKVLALIQQE